MARGRAGERQRLRQREGRGPEDGRGIDGMGLRRWG